MLHCHKRRGAAVCLASVLGLLAWAAPDRAAAQERVVIAIFAPNGAFDSGDARYSFASKLAQGVSAAGLVAEPKAYARAGDFEAAVKKGQVDFAIVDGVYLAERGTPWQVLAIASSGGDTSSRWVLVAPDASAVLDLSGKRLAVAQATARDAAFVDNVLLDGELPKLFASRQATPDVASAVAAVTLHRADAAFAPEAATRGMKKVFEAGKVPNPALVAIKPNLPREVVDKVRSTALSSGGAGAYDGWKSGSSDPYRSLAARFGSRVRRPVMADPQPVTLDALDALALPPHEPSAPDVKSQYWQPPGRP